MTSNSDANGPPGLKGDRTIPTSAARPEGTAKSSVPGFARWCFGHRRLVLGLWLIAFIVVFGADLAAKPSYSTKFQLRTSRLTLVR